MAKKSIGIDIGSYSVKAVEVSESRSKIEITKSVEVLIEDRAVMNGEIRDYEAVISALDQLYVLGDFKKTPATVGMGGATVYPRTRAFPWEPEEAFLQALPFRMTDFIENPEDYAMDHHPMGQYEEGNLFLQKSMVIAAPMLEVEELAQALLAADVKLKRTDFMPFALVRAADGMTNRKHDVPVYPKPDEDLSVEVLIDMGASLTTIAIHDRGCILFVRTFPGGGAGITQALQEQLSLSYDVAEELKKNLGIAKVTEELQKTPALENISDQEYAIASQISSMIVGSLIQQIRETVEYWQFEMDNSVEIKRILLSGGGTKFGGLPQRIASELRAPVGMLRPIKAFGTKAGDRPGMDPRMTMAFGLALDSRGGE